MKRSATRVLFVALICADSVHAEVRDGATSLGAYG
jgi:hypothetical protein